MLGLDTRLLSIKLPNESCPPQSNQIFSARTSAPFPFLAGSLVNFDVELLRPLPATAPFALIHHVLDMLIPQMLVVIAFLALSRLEA